MLLHYLGKNLLLVLSISGAVFLQYVGVWRLRSATQQLMVVPRHRMSTVSRRAFAVHGPVVWNSLPDDLRAQQDYESFRHGLKLGCSAGTSVPSSLETL